MVNYAEFGIFDVAIILLYIVGVIILHEKFSKNNEKVKFLSALLGVTHFLMSIVFYFFILNSVGDSKGYYNTVYHYKSWDDANVLNGSGFIEFCLYPFVKFLNFSFFSASLLFSFVSLIGFYKIFNVFLDLGKTSWSNWFYVLLLPSMHFWTGSIGKDAIIFYGISALFYNFLSKKNLLHYIIPLIIIALVRFYIFAFIGLGISIALIFLNRKVKISTKVFFIAVLSMVSTVVLPYFFKTIAVDGFSNIKSQRDYVARANMAGGGAVDLSDSNLIIKWFSYVFRPFVFEARNVQMIFAAIENLFWMIIFAYIFMAIKRKSVANDRKSLFWISFVCIFTLTLPSAYMLSNLGIASRQKIMIVPFLFFLFFEIVSNSKFQKGKIK